MTMKPACVCVVTTIQHSTKFVWYRYRKSKIVKSSVMSNLGSITNAKLPTYIRYSYHISEAVKTNLNDETQTIINHSAKKLIKHKT